MEEAGYTPTEAAAIEAEVSLYEKVRTEVKLASGDYVDLKMYEPAMRHLIDTYIQAEDSTKVSAFDDLSLVELIVQRGPDAVDALPDGIKESPEAVGETIVNNVRRLIIDRSPVNPRYYESMSELLDGLIARRKQEALSYKDYLDAIVAFTRDLAKGPAVAAYPAALTRPSVRALHDNLGYDEAAALAVDRAVRESFQDGWRDNAIKTRRVSNAVRTALDDFELDGTETEAERQTRVIALIKSQDDY